jgi:hypothetical protein
MLGFPQRYVFEEAAVTRTGQFPGASLGSESIFGKSPKYASAIVTSRVSNYISSLACDLKRL